LVKILDKPSPSTRGIDWLGKTLCDEKRRDHQGGNHQANTEIPVRSHFSSPFLNRFDLFSISSASEDKDSNSMWGKYEEKM
jgi:hypothetical protein